MHKFETEIVPVTEGTTKILVPREALDNTAPPREPAFFNPRARLNRDLSIIAYAAFADGFEGEKIFLDGLSGLGARGLRVANEAKFDKIILNDLNPRALELARESAKLNGLNNVEFSEEETCRFFAKYSRSGLRGTIVDVDPFGSPAKFLDCGLRATIHGGMLSVTATDLQVLNGLFDNACKRRYGGTPIRVQFGNEIAIRLVLGCLRHISARMDMEIEPLFVESDQHYYRMFARVHIRPDQSENIGYVYRCVKCQNRGISQERTKCITCDKPQELAGPLWTGRLFDAKFLQKMTDVMENFTVTKACEKIIKRCILESEMPGAYHTLDETASKLHIPPPSLDDAVSKLKSAGFLASPTSLSHTGFRTDARMEQMAEIL